MAIAFRAPSTGLVTCSRHEAPGSRAQRKAEEEHADDACRSERQDQHGRASRLRAHLPRASRCRTCPRLPRAQARAQAAHAELAARARRGGRARRGAATPGGAEARRRALRAKLSRRRSSTSACCMRRYHEMATSTASRCTRQAARRAPPLQDMQKDSASASVAGTRRRERRPPLLPLGAAILRASDPHRAAAPPRSTTLTRPLKREFEQLEPGDLVFVEGTWATRAATASRSTTWCTSRFTSAANSARAPSRRSARARRWGCVKVPPVQAQPLYDIHGFHRSIDTWLEGKREPTLDRRRSP